MKPKEYWIELTESWESKLVGGDWVPIEDSKSFEVLLNQRMNFITDKPIDESLHVIEYSAYTALEAKLEKAKEIIVDKIRDGCMGYCKFPECLCPNELRPFLEKDENQSPK